MREKDISTIPININESLEFEHAIKKQDRKAVAVLHSKYYTRMKYYIASRINSQLDAEDLTQNIFIELCKGKGCYDHRINNNIESYLFGMARNAISRYHREKIKLLKIISSGPTNNINIIDYNIDQYQNPVIHSSTEELKRIVEYTISQLPPKAREAIRLRFIEGLNSKEGAVIAGCSLNTFYHRLHTAVKSLRKLREQFESII